MKFSVLCSELQRVLSKITAVVPSKSTLPILENILFTLSKNTLHLTATDLEASITTSIDVKGAEDGSIAIPAKRLIDTIRALPDVQLHVATESSTNKIKMMTETGEYILMGESSSEFPAIPQFKPEETLSIKGDVLRRIIGKTIFSVSTDELRPAMTGILLQIKEGEFRVVGTDGHRLVRFQHSSIKNALFTKDVVIPSKAMILVMKSIDEGEITIAMGASNIQFAFGTTTLTTRLIEEAYPNYESVIPLDNEKVLIVDRELLLSSIRRVSLYSSSTTHQIRCSIKKNELRVSAEDIDFGGEAKEKIGCRYDNEDVDIGFNSTYIIDILSHIDSDEVRFNLSSAIRAAIISPEQQRQGEDILMLVMPMRLNT
ncbi:MAG: DNA polymerase III subunit beta [bacterium]